LNSIFQTYTVRLRFGSVPDIHHSDCIYGVPPKVEPNFDTVSWVCIATYINHCRFNNTRQEAMYRNKETALPETRAQTYKYLSGLTLNAFERPTSKTKSILVGLDLSIHDVHFSFETLTVTTADCWNHYVKKSILWTILIKQLGERGSILSNTSKCSRRALWKSNAQYTDLVLPDKWFEPSMCL
jgi:hypothetical protein